MIERAEYQFQEAIAYAIHRKNPNWNRNASHFCQTDVIVEAIPLEEIKLLSRCHTRDLSFQKREPLINSKKPSLMRSTGRVQTETEMLATSAKLTLLWRLLCLKKWNIVLEIDAGIGCVDIPNFRIFWVDIFPPPEKICDFSNFSMGKNHLFFTYFPQRWKIYPPPCHLPVGKVG